MPPRGNIKPVQKAKNFKGTFKKFFVYLRPFMFALLMIAILSIASTAISIMGPSVSGQATTLLFEGVVSKANGGSGINFAGISRILLILLAMYISSALISFICNFIINSVTVKVSYQLRKEIAAKINRLPLSYFDSKTHGEVLSRVTNDVDTISANLSNTIQQFLNSLVTVVGVIAIMVIISLKLTLIALIVIPLSGMLAMLIVKLSQKHFYSQQQYLGHINGHIEEMYSGHIIVKTYNYENKAIEQFEQLNTQLQDSSLKAQFLSGVMMPLSGFLGNIAYVAVCIVGGLEAIAGRIAIGNIQAFFQYVRRLNQPISQISQLMNTIQAMIAAAERVFEILDETELLPETNDPVVVYDEDGNSKVKGEVVFENVRFGYDPQQIIISNFSMFVKPGQNVAIVGPTGAGKTTLVKLLMRFYELNSGTIYVDGQDIRNYRRKDLRDNIGMVLQDAWLYSGSVYDNVRYGKPDADMAEVVAACKQAHVHHFIKTLENGYNTVIGEETAAISQGQKQLLTIARAFLKDPKILILDEATSSVDTRTEQLIQDGMEKLMQGRTSFVIAHRLSTIRNADIILVLDHGDIVEVGNHESLLAMNGFYAKLYNSQFEG